MAADLPQTSGGQGGAIWSGAANVSIINSTISGNTSTLQGGGIYSSSSQLRVVNSTVTENAVPNTDSYTGGGLFVEGGRLAFHNSIVANNTAGAAASADVSFETEQLDVRHSLIGIGDGANLPEGVANPDANGNLIGSVAEPFDPELGPLQDNHGLTMTHAPAVGSPAIGAGSIDLAVDADGNAMQTEQRGLPRLDGEAVSMGSFEWQHTYVVDSISDVVDGDVSPGELSLREAIELVGQSDFADIIEFDADVFATPQTISLTSGPFVLREHVKVLGPGDDLLTIDAKGRSRAFDIRVRDVEGVALNGMRLVGGNAGHDQGGAHPCSHQRHLGS